MDMQVNRRWLWIAGGLGAAGGALALGVPLGTVLIVAALLACPIMMSLGMRGSHHGTGGMGSRPGSEAIDGKREEAASPRVEPSTTSEVVRRN